MPPPGGLTAVCKTTWVGVGVGVGVGAGLGAVDGAGMGAGAGAGTGLGGAGFSTGGAEGAVQAPSKITLITRTVNNPLIRT